MIERSFRMRRAVALAWTALLWERLARVWWPAAFFPALFAVAAVLGLWRVIGDPWRAMALLAALVAAAVFVFRGLRAGPWPTRQAATRRVEEDSNFAGRPFEALSDEPAIADIAGRALWKAHQARMREAAKTAKARRPKAALAAADPFALRGMLVLSAVAAAIIAGPAATERLADAFQPRLMAGSTRSADFQAWINPPDYTARAPIFLDAQARNRPIEAPAGSVFVARAAGVSGAPRLRVEDGADMQRVLFEDAGPGAYEAQVTLERDVRVSIAGNTSASWDVTVLPDRAPAVAFLTKPEADPRQHLELAYEVDDDYGAESVVLRITLIDTPGEEARDEPLPIPTGSNTEENATLDLTTHPWSGVEVELQIVAQDGRGQEGRSLPVRMTLPERVFVNPLARALVHERSVLVQSEEPYAPLAERPAQDAEGARLAPPVELDESERRIDRAPPAVARVRESLELMQDGAEHFEEDYAVHLALSYLSERLRRGRSRAEIADVPEVMWEAALRAEGGDLADAERALREARRLLAEALARGAPEQEIAELMENFQSAVQRYLDALMAEAIRNGEVMENFAGGGGDAMGEDALQEMLRALEELAETGSTDDARRLLQALSEMLLNMQMQLTMGGGGGGANNPPSEELQELRDQLEELADLIGRQRELMDQTQRENSQAGDPQDGQESGADGQQQPGQSGSTPGGQQREFSDEGGAAQSDLAQQNGAGRGRSGELSEELAQALADQQRELAEQLETLAQNLANQDGDGEAGGADDETGEAGGGDGEDGEVGLRLEEAEEAMSLAERELRSGDGDEALRGQGEALDRLRAAVDSLAQEAMETAQREAGGPTSDPMQLDTQARDPFGRRSGGSGLGVGDDVDVPDEAERRRAREILEELRRRLEETGRSQEELDYLMRLLDRF